MTYGGRERMYLVHVPRSYDPAKRAPLVLVFHGGTRNAASTERLTGMSDKSEEEGFIAVYPNGTGRFQRVLVWNVEFGFAYALRNNVDDVGFIRELVGRLERELDIDPKRIFATGISNGGMLSYLVASKLSDLVAAVAPVAGASGGRQYAGAPLIIYPKPKDPVSIIAFNGMADKLVQYNGGQGTGFANADYVSVPESIGLWVKYDGCRTTPLHETSASGNIVKDTYPGGKDSTEVVLYTIMNGGHAWPGGKLPVWANGDAPTSEISATDIMWRFFKDHPKK